MMTTAYSEDGHLLYGTRCLNQSGLDDVAADVCNGMSLQVLFLSSLQPPRREVQTAIAPRGIRHAPQSKTVSGKALESLCGCCLDLVGLCQGLATISL